MPKNNDEKAVKKIPNDTKKKNTEKEPINNNEHNNKNKEPKEKKKNKVSLKWKIIAGIYLLLLLANLWILIYNHFFSPDVAIKKAIEKVDKKYEKHIPITQLKELLKENKDNFIKIIYPEYEDINFFQLLLKDPKENKINYYYVYKDIDKEWKNYSISQILKEAWIEDNIIDKKYNGWVWMIDENAWNKALVQIISAILPLFIFIPLIVFLLMYQTGTFSKAPLTLFKTNDKNKINFEDIGWLESNKEEIKEIIETLKNFKNFKERWVRAMRWILFYGPPWTWKTMLAKAIASQVWMDIFIASANDFWSKYINEWPQKVKKSFKEIEKFIKKHKKDYAILFVDELDAILKQRGSWHSEDDKVVNAFLDRIDGIEWSANIILIGATNYLDKIDEASLSRFDRKLQFFLPTKDERIDIINKILNKRKKEDSDLTISDDFNIELLADYTEWKSWRDIEVIINELHRKAILYKRNLDNEFLSEIIMDILLWKKRTVKNQNEEDTKTIAYHELGHAFIWHYFWKIVHILTIEARGMSGGSSWSVKDPDKPKLSDKEDLLNEIRELVAWRVAERVFLNKETIWAKNDYERATKIAEAYFKEYNLSYKWFSLWMIINEQNNKNAIIESEVFKKLNEKISEMIKDQEKIVEDILKEKKEYFQELYQLLIEKKVLYRKDFITYLKNINESSNN